MKVNQFLLMTSNRTFIIIYDMAHDYAEITRGNANDVYYMLSDNFNERYVHHINVERNTLEIYID